MSNWMTEERDHLLDTLDKIENALTRQADVMERDVEAEQELTKEDLSLAERIENQWQGNVRSWGDYLELVVTRAYKNDMERARAIREVITKMQQFEVPTEG